MRTPKKVYQDWRSVHPGRLTPDELAAAERADMMDTLRAGHDWLRQHGSEGPPADMLEPEPGPWPPDDPAACVDLLDATYWPYPFPEAEAGPEAGQ